MNKSESRSFENSLVFLIGLYSLYTLWTIVNNSENIVEILSNPIYFFMLFIIIAIGGLCLVEAVYRANVPEPDFASIMLHDLHVYDTLYKNMITKLTAEDKLHKCMQEKYILRYIGIYTEMFRFGFYKFSFLFLALMHLVSLTVKLQIMISSDWVFTISFFVISALIWKIAKQFNHMKQCRKILAACTQKTPSEFIEHVFNCL